METELKSEKETRGSGGSCSEVTEPRKSIGFWSMYALPKYILVSRLETVPIFPTGPSGSVVHKESEDSEGTVYLKSMSNILQKYESFRWNTTTFLC